MRIDAHQHFWDPDAGDYPWMAGPDMAPIRRVFGPGDLAPLAARQGITRTITVQCRHDLEETRAMLRCAAEHDLVAGVVGWVDLTGDHVAGDLAALKAGPGGPYLVGIRHIVHDEADPDWLDRADVRAGLAQVFEAGLTFDLLLKPRDVPSAIRCVAAFPDARFVLDHGAKPRIGDGAQFDDEWATLIDTLAGHPNVWCKLSGLVTEADWAHWTADRIQPYGAHLVAAFGSRRIMFGSDWPVCTLAAGYGEVADLARTIVAEDVAADDFYTAAACVAYALDAERIGT